MSDTEKMEATAPRGELYDAVINNQRDRIHELLIRGVWDLSAYNVAKTRGECEMAYRILQNHPDGERKS